MAFTDTKRRMTGGGSVFTSDVTRVTHGFELHCSTLQKPNNLQVNWSGNRFHLENLSAVTCLDDPALNPAPPPAGFDTYIAEGNGGYNGVSGATIRWTFTDDGETGVDDMATMEIKDKDGNLVLSVSGKLTFGNHQAHGK